jgi:hypothetical protein
MFICTLVSPVDSVSNITCVRPQLQHNPTPPCAATWEHELAQTHGAPTGRINGTVIHVKLGWNVSCDRRDEIAVRKPHWQRPLLYSSSSAVVVWYMGVLMSSILHTCVWHWLTAQRGLAMYNAHVYNSKYYGHVTRDRPVPSEETRDRGKTSAWWKALDLTGNQGELTNCRSQHGFDSELC